MKFKIEMNAEEMARGIQNGVLQALVECDSTRQEPVQNMARTTPAIVKEPEPAVAEVAKVDTGTGTITGETPKTEYTLQQLAMAGVKLCDQGKREEVLEIIKGFGVDSVAAIPEESRNAYAEKLKAIGAEF